MKKLICIMACILLIFSLSGCWSYHELNDYSVVVGVGIDKVPNSENILLTSQIAKAGELSENGEGGGSSNKKAYWNIQNEGETVFSIIREYSHESGRKLYFPHNKIIILSREIAEEGVQKYIDFFARDPELRSTSWVFVADKDKTSDILDVTPELEKVPSMHIDKLADTQQYNAETYSIELLPFLQRLMSKSTAPVAPLIGISGEGEKQKIIISGCAVFKKGKLVGQLNKFETRGLLWVDGEVKSGIIVVPCPGGEGKVDLEITQASSSITPEIKDGNIIIKIEIKEKSNLSSQSCTEDLATSEMLKVLEGKNASTIRDAIVASVKKAQKLNADVFGFGEAVQRKYPDQWKDIESKWDEIFPNIQIKINVDAEVYGTGKISKPVSPEEG